MVSDRNMTGKILIAACVLIIISACCGLFWMDNDHSGEKQIREDDRKDMKGADPRVKGSNDVVVDGNNESGVNQIISCADTHKTSTQDNLLGEIFEIQMFTTKNKQLSQYKKDEVYVASVNIVPREITGEEMTRMYKRWLSYQPQAELNKTGSSLDQKSASEVFKDKILYFKGLIWANPVPILLGFWYVLLRNIEQ